MLGSGQVRRLSRVWVSFIGADKSISPATKTRGRTAFAGGDDTGTNAEDDDEEEEEEEEEEEDVVDEDVGSGAKSTAAAAELMMDGRRSSPVRSMVTVPPVVEATAAEDDEDDAEEEEEEEGDDIDELPESAAETETAGLLAAAEICDATAENSISTSLFATMPGWRQVGHLKPRVVVVAADATRRCMQHSKQMEWRHGRKVGRRRALDCMQKAQASSSAAFCWASEASVELG